MVTTDDTTTATSASEGGNNSSTLAQFHLSRDGLYYQHLLPPFYPKNKKENEGHPPHTTTTTTTPSSPAVLDDNEPILFHITSTRELPSLTTMLLPPTPTHTSLSCESTEDNRHNNPGITVDILPTYDSDYWTRRALSLFL